MDVLVHAIVFAVAIVIIWFFAGALVDAVGRLSRRYCKSGFFTAFFVLGFFTSISEFSVAANSVLGGVPSVSAGNLIGASFVILFLIVPLLAIAGKGIQLNGSVTDGTLALILGAIALPALLVLDGSISRTEGLLCLLAYGTVAFALYRKRAPIMACELEFGTLPGRLRATGVDLLKIAIGGLAIFTAAHFLVEQAVYFASVLEVPDSLVGLVMLSLGTNVPEIVIAFRSVFRGRSDIAFGDYLGSAAMNTLIFGLLAVGSSTIFLEASEFIMTGLLFTAGLGLLFTFANSRLTISRKEGIVLVLFYVAFLALQVANAAWFS